MSVRAPLVLVHAASRVGYSQSFLRLSAERVVVSAVGLENLGELGPRVHLVGHGPSGALVTGYALRNPAGVASLVLVDSIPPEPAERDALGRSMVPTLAFACGAPFGAMGTEMFDAMRSAPKQLCVLPRSGHFPWVDEPATFFRELSAFLRENDAEGALRPGASAG